MKRVITLAFFLVNFVAFSQNEWKITADSLSCIAKKQIGVKYKYATCNPGTSFDCSGFTSYVYNSLSIPNSRSSKGYKNLGEEVSLEECRKGDCILFTGTDSSVRTIGHVGIVLENTENGIQFIHCSSAKKHFGVTVTHYQKSGYPKRFLEVRRLF